MVWGKAHGQHGSAACVRVCECNVTGIVNVLGAESLRLTTNGRGVIASAGLLCFGRSC
jgi:hypothetical protein